MEPLKVITVTEEQLESLIDKKIDQLHDAVKKQSEITDPLLDIASLKVNLKWPDGKARRLVKEGRLKPEFTGNGKKLNFEAIKESEPTEIDPRRYGAPLWPERHSLESLEQRRALDPFRFDCMYQGHPSSKEGLLYGDNFKTYDTPTGSDEIIRKANYTDTADTGTDYLCSICYDVLKGGQINITDVLYTQAPMEETEPATAQMLLRNGTRAALIESNNGGRGFARNVQRKATAVHVEWFHQSGNKESRILTNSATVLQNIRFPEGWRLRWPELYAHLTTYKRLFKANKNDDAPDALTGIVEKEIINKNNRILYMG